MRELLAVPIGIEREAFCHKAFDPGVRLSYFSISLSNRVMVFIANAPLEPRFPHHTPLSWRRRNPRENLRLGCSCWTCSIPSPKITGSNTWGLRGRLTHFLRQTLAASFQFRRSRLPNSSRLIKPDNLAQTVTQRAVYVPERLANLLATPS